MSHVTATILMYDHSWWVYSSSKTESLHVIIVPPSVHTGSGSHFVLANISYSDFEYRLNTYLLTTNFLDFNFVIQFIVCMHVQ